MIYKVKKNFPKRALPLDTPFKIRGMTHKAVLIAEEYPDREYLLNANNPELEYLGFYMRDNPEDKWGLTCSNNSCKNEECLVKNQANYKFLFNWKDVIQYTTPELMAIHVL